MEVNLETLRLNGGVRHETPNLPRGNEGAEGGAVLYRMARTTRRERFDKKRRKQPNHR